MKTKKGWDDSNLELGDYMPFPTMIDEELYLYLLEVVPPQYSTDAVGQCGEADSEDSNGVFTYSTVSTIRGHHFYLGVLPELKESPDEDSEPEEKFCEMCPHNGF